MNRLQSTGQLLQIFAMRQRWPESVEAIGLAVSGVCLLMLVIGASYLLVNAWWIRAALRKPPPMMDQILLPPLPDADTRLETDFE